MSAIDSYYTVTTVHENTTDEEDEEEDQAGLEASINHQNPFEHDTVSWLDEDDHDHDDDDDDIIGRKENYDASNQNQEVNDDDDDGTKENRYATTSEFNKVNTKEKKEKDFTNEFSQDLDQKEKESENQQIQQSSSFALDSFRDEMDAITKALDDESSSHVNLEELFQKAKTVTSKNSTSTSTTEMHNNNNKNNDSFRTQDYNNNNNCCNISQLSASTPVAVTYKTAAVPQSIGGRRSEPPTPVKTPASTFMSPLSNTTPNIYSSHLRSHYQSDDNDDNNNNSFLQGLEESAKNSAYLGRGRMSGRAKQRGEATKPIAPPSPDDFQSGTYEENEKDGPPLDDWKYLLETMKDRLERQEERIRQLEEENAMLRRNSSSSNRQRQNDERHNTATATAATPSIVLQSPPPLFPRSHRTSPKIRTQPPFPTNTESVAAAGSSSSSHPISSPLRSTKKLLSRNPFRLETYNEDHNRSIRNNDIVGNTPLSSTPRRHLYGSKNNNSRDDDNLEYYYNQQQQQQEEEYYQERVILQDRTVFSPGTQFVEELSRVVEIPQGHYAALSIIMDKHYERVSQKIRGRHGWDETEYHHHNDDYR